MRRPIIRTRQTLTATRDADLPVFGVANPVPATMEELRRNTPAPMPGKSATAVGTRTASLNIAPVEGAAQKWGALAASGARDIYSDEQARNIAGLNDAVVEHDGVEERKPEMLPAVISRAIAIADDVLIEPEWHMVKHLPGYVQQGVRAMGRTVFRQFTDKALEEIQTVTTLTNPEIEVKALMGWISRNGIRDDQAEMDFSESIPSGYKAEVQAWSTEGYTFLLVKDFAGHYVYGWPGGRGVHLDNDAPPLLLK